MKWMFEQYVSDPAQRGSDLMSPVRASAERLRGLPPTLIAVAENDILRDEGEKMDACWTRRASRLRPCASTA